MHKFRNLTNWLHAKIAQKMLYSLKSTILSFYIPIIILFIFMTGTVSYWLAAQQIEDNAYSKEPMGTEPMGTRSQWGRAFFVNKGVTL